MKPRLLLLCALLLILGSAGAFGVTQSRSAAAATSTLSVVGNHLVDNGNTVILRGVNRSGAEYACYQNFGFFDGPSDDASIAAIAAWGTNVVRVPFNESCWLGINGVPAQYSGANYQAAIVGFVSRLRAHGLYVILDNQFGGPGTTKATTILPMPDADHAPTLWTQVANTFKSDKGVIFDLYNEPHDVPWSCWANGCMVTGGVNWIANYQAAGMNSLTTAIRATGATNVIMIGGLSWEYDISGWLTNRPNDGQLIASIHNYGVSGWDTPAIWDNIYAPTAVQVPVTFGEMGFDVYVEKVMTWADAHGIGYLAWTWDTWGNQQALISDYSGTATTYGLNFKNYLAGLALPTPTIYPTPTPTPSPMPTPTPTPTPGAPCTNSQYSLTGNNGSTWVNVDATHLSLNFTPTVSSWAVLSGNADLWTATAGLNQDLGIAVSGGSYPSTTGQPEAWKESGGFAGTFSPNAAFVKAVIPVVGGTTYSAKLQWKTNMAGSGSIHAGSGPIGGSFSPTCMAVQLITTSPLTLMTKSSATQHSLTGSNGSTWQNVDATNLSLSFTAPSAGVLLLSGNADLWTSSSGFNQDIGVSLSGGIYPTTPGQPEAWKESGGFAGTFSPNAAYVQAPMPVASGVTYIATLKWKTNKADPGSIYAGAGPIGGKFSPTTLTLIFFPAASAPHDGVSTSQYTLPNSNGSAWVAMDAIKLKVSYTPGSDCTAVVAGNVDLWTANAGVNQDIGISISGGTLPTYAGQPEAWKESGGFAGTFSPNAAFVQKVVVLKAGNAYTFQLTWKTNAPAPGATIYAGAGPIGGKFSPTHLTVTPIGC